MIPKEILTQVRRIQITTSRLADDCFSGQYQSVFKGKGIAFEEVRPYLPGDEIRSIDWNVTARMNAPYVKKFVEEREMTVMLVLDMSASSVFGTRSQLKSQLAATLAAVLAFSAVDNNDKVGFIAFTDRIEKFIPPRKGLRHVLRIIREALYFKPHGIQTNVSGALDYLNKVINRRSVVFVISDFLASGYKKSLSIARKKHDIVPVVITDPAENELPQAGLLRMQDPETQEMTCLDTDDLFVRNQYKERVSLLQEERNALFVSLGLDSITVQTDKQYTNSLMAFFKRRKLRNRI